MPGLGFSLKALGFRFRDITQPLIAKEFQRRYPNAMKTLEQYIAESEAKTQFVEKKVDIGLAPHRPKQSTYAKERSLIIKKNKNDLELEQRARRQELHVPLHDVYKEWSVNNGPLHIKKMAQHYGIFNDLFQHAYFTPWNVMDIKFPSGEEHVSPVYRGNIIYPSECKSAPSVEFQAEPDSLWTLILTSLDSHLTETSHEYLHWMVGNIKNGEIDQGETICDYMQPIPAHGTGYHRMVFVLYKHDSEIDFSKLKKKTPCLCLKERTFKTFDFYKSHQDVMTPVGLSFFQTTWDESLTDFFHNVLNMKEPRFEYQHPVHEFNAQVRDPHQKNFNFYLDHHRDPKEINKEILLQRLKNLNPFEPEPPQSEYPDVHHISTEVPSWKRDEIRKARRRVGKYSYL